MVFFLNVLKALVLGVVQGLTEWLPVSSTFHMALFRPFVTLEVFENTADNEMFWELFKVFIRLGAILAVCFLYKNKLNYFNVKKKKRKREILQLWIKIICTSIPVGIGGILLEEWFHKNMNTFVFMACISVVLGICFILTGNHKRRPGINTLDAVSYKEAFAVGVFQTLALIPGTGRSACIILGSRVLGFSRMAAAEFSLYTAIPVILGLGLIRIIRYHALITFSSFFILLVAFLSTFCISLVVIRMYMKYIRDHDFRVFGFYRMILGFAVLFLVLCGVLV